MSEAVIGIVPLVDRQRESYWMLPGYMEGIAQAGGLPLMLPLTHDEDTLRDLLGICDGFLLPGGHDISPELYDQKPGETCGELCPERDAMEIRLLELLVEEDRPVFGICRGIQLINAWMGGSLYQDLPTEHPSATVHCQKPPYDRPSHRVWIVPESPLFAVLQTCELQVNSYHHQAVRELAPGLKTMAVAEDGVIEAVYDPSRAFFWAIQWHPEFSWRTDAHSRCLFRAFVDGCRGRRRS